MQIRLFATAALLAVISFASAQTVGERHLGTIAAIDWSESLIKVNDQLFRLNRSAGVTGLAEEQVTADNLEPGLLIEYSIGETRGQAGTPSIQQIHVLPK